MVVISRLICEQLDIIPMQVRMQQHVRLVYAILLGQTGSLSSRAQ
jgi:hypothetical protein